MKLPIKTPTLSTSRGPKESAALDEDEDEEEHGAEQGAKGEVAAAVAVAVVEEVVVTEMLARVRRKDLKGEKEGPANPRIPVLNSSV